ncbi:MAG: UDP-2,3-diacylglucosamine diphosphatase [Bacteroidales bacterium]
MAEKNQIYFASDFHLGMHPGEKSRLRESYIVDWLELIRHDAKEIWLLGDVFDYWFEYKKVIPRGFVRFLGKLATLADEGVEIHLFPGNHDVWLFNYLPEEIGLTIHHNILVKVWNNKKFLLGHGDGLLKSDLGYRLLQGVFRNRILQWLYARIHPNGSMTFAQWWSRKSRSTKGAYLPFLGATREHQAVFAKKILETQPDINYFVFGHRHLPFQIRLSPTSRVVCLGDWITNFTYAVFDGEELHLKKFFPDRGSIITI